MPELPDLEVVRDVLNDRIASQQITGIEILSPLVLLSLAVDEPKAFFVGQTVERIVRSGKFLVFKLSAESWMVWNFMLAGHLRFCSTGDRALTRDYVKIDTSAGIHMRYYDARGMGKLYLTDDLSKVPGYAEMGPDALDDALTLGLFLDRLKRYRGEIKGILTRGTFVAGIGNAYADEILWAARIYPFRKAPSLSAEEKERLYRAMRDVLIAACESVRERMGDEIHLKVRDMLAVHNRKGEPCPRCGQTISEVNVRKRATDFCRQCQPGSLLQR